MSDYIYRGGRPAQADAPALVMVHGAGMDHTVWTPLARYHARRGYNVVAVDLPGRGRSTGESLGSIDAMADWLGELMEREALLQPFLVGHSMGSAIVLELAARLGEDCSGLALLGAVAPMPVGQPLLDAAERNEQAAIDMVCLFGHGFKAQLGANPVCGVNVLNTAVRLMQQTPPNVLFNDLNACNNWQNSLERAAQITCASTLILGSKDKMTPPKAAAALADQLRHGETIMIESGHMMMAESPEATHQALIKALLRRRSP